MFLEKHRCLDRYLFKTHCGRAGENDKREREREREREEMKEGDLVTRNV
jgi:hypothetical protein